MEDLVRLACYDPGARHLGEACLDVPDDGAKPLCLLAGHVTVGATDDALSGLARRLREGWSSAGVERVVIERVAGLGGTQDGPAAIIGRANYLIQAARVGSLIHGVALALELPVVTYHVRTVRAGLRVDAAGVGAYVREHVEGWAREGEPAPPGAPGDWYLHPYDAALVGLWDVASRAAVAAPRVRSVRGPQAPRGPRGLARQKLEERARAGCTCGQQHRKGCPLYTRPATYRKKGVDSQEARDIVIHMNNADNTANHTDIEQGNIRAGPG